MIKLRFVNKLIILLVVVSYFCDLILYIGTSYNTNTINPKNITLVIFIPLFLFSILTGSVKLNSIINKPIVRWLLVYLLASIFALGMGLDKVETYNAFRTVIFAIIIIFMITGLMDNPRNRAFAIKVMIAGMLFSSLINVTEFFGITHIGLFSGRPAGFYINPNSAGIALSFGLVLVTSYVSKKWRTFFVLFTGIGILFTFSRAAFFFFVLYLIYYLFIQKGVSRNAKFVICFLILAGGIIFNQKVLSEFNSGDSNIPGLNSNVQSRISFFNNPLQHEESVTNGSRVDFLKYSFSQYLDKPIFGHGLGFDQTMVHNGQEIESHNEIVHLLLGYGIFGLFLLIYFWIRMHHKLDPANKLLFRNVLLTFLFFCFFSHNLFEEYSLLFILGFIAAALPKTSGVWITKKRAVIYQNQSNQPVI